MIHQQEKSYHINRYSYIMEPMIMTLNCLNTILSINALFVIILKQMFVVSLKNTNSYVKVQEQSTDNIPI
jgi:hypothetical protein